MENSARSERPVRSPRKLIGLSAEVIGWLDELRAEHALSYDGVLRMLGGLPAYVPAKLGRPAGVSKWPFQSMEAGATVRLSPPPGGEAKHWDRMRAAVVRAEQGTGKRFRYGREGSHVWVTRVA